MAAVGELSAVATAMAAATEAAGNLVRATRDIVRDLIADLVARVVVWAAEAIFVVTIPVIDAQITAAVAKWAARIRQHPSADEVARARHEAGDAGLIVRRVLQTGPEDAAPVLNGNWLLLTRLDGGDSEWSVGGMAVIVRMLATRRFPVGSPGR